MGEVCADGEGGFSDGGVLVVSGLRVLGRTGALMMGWLLTVRLS